MCGRYALGIRASFVRYQLQQQNMQVDESPEDDEVRESYNFAPGYHGLVYRADTPDHGAVGRARGGGAESEALTDPSESQSGPDIASQAGEVRYKLQSMKWGLVPFWTKRNPDYGSVMKTINARDDALASSGGMWYTMKQKKRCIVIAQGFYEWLKKSGGKEKIPHFVRRKDEQLMCFAGLWDCVQYEGSDEKNYTYTIITTDSNKQLSFLHDRMPVILENGSEDIRTWLDPERTEWSKDLQSLLRPYQGEVDCYPVHKDVGKVGNNSPTFLIPVASKENKSNIANFFAKARQSEKSTPKSLHNDHKSEVPPTKEKKMQSEAEQKGTGENAPPSEPVKIGTKRAFEAYLEAKDSTGTQSDQGQAGQAIKQASPSKRVRSATSNGSAKQSPAKSSGNQKISDFFKT